MAQTTGAGDYIQSVTGNYSMTRNDALVKGDCTGGSLTITLPDATKCGALIYVAKRIAGGVNTVTVNCMGGQTIDGASSVTLSLLNSALAVISDGVNWLKVSVI